MRTTRRLLTVLAPAVAATLAVATPASAALVVQANWTMDEAVGATVMSDSTANNNDGAIPTGVTTGQPGFSGKAYLFSGQGPVTVPSSASLNPLNTNFSYSARVKQTAAQGAGEQNVLQKGLIGAFNGQYKLELNDGVPACYIRDVKDASGVARTAQAIGTVSVADGAWHKLSCLVNASTLTLYVDGVAARQVDASSVGSINPGNKLTLGGKETCNSLGCDYYTGYMDDAFVAVG